MEKRNKAKERPMKLVRPTEIRPPADYALVKSYIQKLEEDGAVHMHKFKRDPKNTALMSIKNVYMLENFASRMASLWKTDIYTQDLMFLIWMRDYEYVSRTYITKTIGFPSHYASYKFMQRQVNNGYVKMVRTRQVGIHNGSAFYLTSKGEELASRVYNALREGNLNSFEH